MKLQIKDVELISFRGGLINTNHPEQYVISSWRHSFNRLMVARGIAKHIGCKVDEEILRLAGRMIKKAKDKGIIKANRPNGRNYEQIRTV